MPCVFACLCLQRPVSLQAGGKQSLELTFSANCLTLPEAEINTKAIAAREHFSVVHGQKPKALPKPIQWKNSSELFNGWSPNTMPKPVELNISLCRYYLTRSQNVRVILNWPVARGGHTSVPVNVFVKYFHVFDTSPQYPGTLFRASLSETYSACSRMCIMPVFCDGLDVYVSSIAVISFPNITSRKGWHKYAVFPIINQLSFNTYI